jgi:nucleotide-binding universal stress UspA family protein
VEQSDEPGSEILQYARSHDIDLIVMGTHGRTGLARAALGSVAESVVRAASCPVLTVRVRTRHEETLGGAGENRANR